MIRRYLMILCAFLFLRTAFADERKTVKLSDDHPVEILRFSYFNLFINRSETSTEQEARVVIMVENLDETNALVLFGRNYSEKAMKRLFPSVSYSGIFGGAKGQRSADVCTGVERFAVVQPTDKYIIPSMTVNDGEILTCHIPVYLGKCKMKNNAVRKVQLLEKEVVELVIEVEVRPDDDFERISEECDDLVDEIERRSFCPSPHHSPSLKGQKQAYQKKIDKLNDEIDNILRRRGWLPIADAMTDEVCDSVASIPEDPVWLPVDELSFPSSLAKEKFIEYMKLKLKLSNVEWKETLCKKHRGGTATPQPKPSGPTGHSCGYCSLSMQQIYHQLDDYYKRIYNSSDRKAEKAKVIGNVKALYNCAKAAKRQDSSMMSKVTDRYNRINNF